MLSPAKAAKQANVSRRTIMVAIESHKLNANRNNRNHWQITPDNLKNWMEERDTLPSPAGDTPTDTVSPNPELLIQIRGLEVELKATQERLADTKEDRDEWRQQAKDLAQRRRWWHL